MKPQQTEILDRPAVNTRAAAQAARSLQEELVAAIHGAFEVAVQIAVQEVKKLVGQTAGPGYEEMRRENESLKERLQRAEALLDCGRIKEKGESPARSKLKPSATKHADQLFRPTSDDVIGDPGVGEEHGCRGVKGDRPVDHSRAQQLAPLRHEHVGRGEEQRSGDSDLTHQVIAVCHSEEERKKEVTEAISPQCVMKVESQDAAGQSPHLASHPSPHEMFTLEQVVVKQEATEDDERDGSACCLDPIKVEDFGLECISAVPSKMLEWEPDEADAESQHPNTRLAQAHPPSMTTGLPPLPDLPSLSSEFPFFQVTEQAPIPEVPQHIYGVHIRGGRNRGHNVNVYTCKSCSQTFHLPSLLRRHYSQCPQKLQQCCQQPVLGGKRTRLQLYPPGCSPFRCTECNREFNRMENLKTHLRIHTGERPYTCSVCSKCFRHSGALTRHFRIHTGEKPYVCGQCGKSFRNCGGLKFHQRSHREQLQKSGTPQY